MVALGALNFLNSIMIIKFNSNMSKLVHLEPGLFTSHFTELCANPYCVNVTLKLKGKKKTLTRILQGVLNKIHRKKGKKKPQHFF